MQARLKAQREAAEVAWDAKRPQLPDEQYASGTPVGEVEAEIAWGEDTEAPLRLGIASIEEGARWRPGETVRFDVYLCNDSDEPVRFAWIARHDEGLSVDLLDSEGKVHAARITPFSALSTPLTPR